MTLGGTWKAFQVVFWCECLLGFLRQLMPASSGDSHDLESPGKTKLLDERNWREDEWRGKFDQSDSILFVCQRRENFSSSNSITVYISYEFYIEFPAAHRYPWCNAQSKFALSRSPSIDVIDVCLYCTGQMQQNGVAGSNSSHVFKLKCIYHSIYLFSSHGIKLPPMRHESCVAWQNEFVAWQKLLPNLVFQLVVWHHLNVSNIFTSVCEKVRLIQI